MSRPKKNSDTPAARQRILDAFWHQLETSRLNEITVSDLCKEAECNRGTFYYHFENFDALVLAAIEDELLWSKGIVLMVFNLIAAPDDTTLGQVLSSERTKHLRLILNKSDNHELIESKVKSVLRELWSIVLCPNGEELSVSVRCVIEYAGSGILGLLGSDMFDELSNDDELLRTITRFVQEIASFIVDGVAKAQGLTKDEVVQRLDTFNRLSKFNR